MNDFASTSILPRRSTAERLASNSGLAIPAHSSKEIETGRIMRCVVLANSPRDVGGRERS